MKPDRKRNVIGGRIKLLRERRGLTQDNLAARCDMLGFRIGQVTVSQIENGVRGVSDHEMILLAKALRVDVSELVPQKLPKWEKDLRPPLAKPDKG